MTPEIRIITSVTINVLLLSPIHFSFWARISCPDLMQRFPLEPYGGFNVVTTGGTIKAPNPNPPPTITRATSRMQAFVDMPTCAVAEADRRPLGGVRTALFTLGSAQVTRVCGLLSLLWLLWLQKWMMMVLFAWNAQRLNWLTTPPRPAPPSHPPLTLLLQFP